MRCFLWSNRKVPSKHISTVQSDDCLQTEIKAIQSQEEYDVRLNWLQEVAPLSVLILPFEAGCFFSLYLAKVKKLFCVNFANIRPLSWSKISWHLFHSQMLYIISCQMIKFEGCWVSFIKKSSSINTFLLILANYIVFIVPIVEFSLLILIEPVLQVVRHATQHSAILNKKELFFKYFDDISDRIDKFNG